jgi:signal transduction histidine kinase
MAHDLKSPFNGLLGSSQFLKDHFDSMEEEAVKTFIHNINMLAINFKYIIDAFKLVNIAERHHTFPSC